MKVLHISSAEVFGGIESILVSLAHHRHLCPGLEHHFALSVEGRLSEELRAAGAPLYLLGGARLSRPLRVRRARKSLALAIRQSGCDVALCHGPRSLIFFAPTVRASRVPLAWWAHGVKSRHHYLNALLRRVPPDLSICCSEYVQQAVASLFPSWESLVIRAPIAMDANKDGQSSRHAVRRELLVDEDTIVIALAGRMVPYKGHRSLIHALAALKGDPSWRCWIVGGPQARREQAYFRSLRDDARDIGLADQIHFLGQRVDVPRILAAADVYCQPNLRGDSFAIVFIEAMLAGLPVVTSAAGGALEAIDHDSGILVPPGDRQALAEVLETLLTDPVLRRRLGSNGPARARRLCDPADRLRDLQAALEAVVLPRN